MKYLIIPIMAILFQSCFKEDERVMPYPGITTTINDSVQTHQSFFDFESGRVVAVSGLSEWQLGFESGADGWHIVTNSGGGWFIHNTGQKTMPSGASIPLQLNTQYDVPHLWPDSTAVGHWVYTDRDPFLYTNHVYLLGKLVNGNFMNLTEVKFLSLTDTSYVFTYLSSESSDTVTIIKNAGYNFVYYSFDLKSQVQPEPPKNSYDIVFTSYYDLATLFGQTMPYHVGGALLNVWKTEVALDSVLSFEDISLQTIPVLHFSPTRDIPGYRWKNVTVDITGGGTATYNVRTGYNYIFRTSGGNYFKMRFLSYTLDGRSGYPRFEYSGL